MTVPRTYFKRWREFAGLTQAQLARKIGTTEATVSRVETGKRAFSPNYLFAFAKACDCEPGDPVNGPPPFRMSIFLCSNAETEHIAIAMLRAPH